MRRTKADSSSDEMDTIFLVAVGGLLAALAFLLPVDWRFLSVVIVEERSAGDKMERERTRGERGEKE